MDLPALGPKPRAPLPTGGYADLMKPLASCRTASLTALLFAAVGHAWGGPVLKTSLSAVSLPPSAIAPAAGYATPAPTLGPTYNLAAPAAATPAVTPAVSPRATSALPSASILPLVRLARAEPETEQPESGIANFFDGRIDRESNGTILVTGFQPFGGLEQNVAQDAAQGLHGARLEVYARSNDKYPAASYHVVSQILPVSYERAGTAIADAIARFRPAAVLMLGLSGRTPSLEVEKNARNSMNTPGFPDADGRVYEGTPINPSGPDAYTTAIPVNEMVGALIQAGFPAMASEDAEGYVCNSVYYCALQAAAKVGLKMAPVFMHMPPAAEHLSEQDKTVLPHWPIAALHEAAGYATRWLVAHATVKSA